jgi:hypothetical protein
MAPFLSILMRHALALALAVSSLSLGVICRTFGRLLVPPSSLPHLPTTMFLSAFRRAGRASSAERAEGDQPPAEATDRELQGRFHVVLFARSGEHHKPEFGGRRGRIAPPGTVRNRRISTAVYTAGRSHLPAVGERVPAHRARPVVHARGPAEAARALEARAVRG